MRKQWTETDIQILREMTAAGETLDAMAERLGSDRMTVSSYRYKHGISSARSSCEYCGGKVTQPARGRRRRFCKASCASANFQLKSQVQPEARSCQRCGDDLTSRQRLYCGRVCSSRAWYERARQDPELVALRNARTRQWQLDHPEETKARQRASYHRKRAAPNRENAVVSR